MGKAKRKPCPSVPHYIWLDRDDCWFCKNPNNCNQCKANRKWLKENASKKEKGRYT